MYSHFPFSFIFIIHCILILFITSYIKRASIAGFLEKVCEDIAQKANISQIIMSECFERIGPNYFVNHGCKALYSNWNSTTVQKLQQGWQLWSKSYYGCTNIDCRLNKSTNVESNSEVAEENATVKEISFSKYFCLGKQEKHLLSSEQHLKRVSKFVNQRLLQRDSPDKEHCSYSNNSYNKDLKFFKRTLLEVYSDSNYGIRNEYDYGDGINDELDGVVDDTIIKRSNLAIISKISPQEYEYDSYETGAENSQGCLCSPFSTVIICITINALVLIAILCF